MSFLYIYERAAKIGVRDNCIVVESEKENLKRTLPIEGVESVIIFGDASLSSKCVMHFMERDINLTWLSSKGKFYGRLESTRNVNIYRQRRQFACGEDDEFCLALSKKIIVAKVKNQITILRRYQRNRPETSVRNIIDAMAKLIPLMERVYNKNQLMGHEGVAARYYYQGLAALVEPEFTFSGRNRQPPRDPFNSLLSFAYTLLMYDLYTAVVNRGLNPYASFLHSIRSGHPALCSDLMEEWRAILADSLALYVTSKGIIKRDNFQKPNPEGGVYLDSKGSKAYIAEYEKKVRTRSHYITYVDYTVSFRRAIEMQCQRLAKAVEEGDPSIYQPVVIR
ncbi:MAG: CRISPR-associated endonuclease Cas1 [Syntrophomonadaceae bacterium]|nr:CRISPR-associated endonuclease Cas1 [Syntrophomonadaceae bacterium]